MISNAKLVPVFSGKEKDVKIRAQDLASETVEEMERYVMPLSDSQRLASGTPGIVDNMSEF